MKNASYVFGDIKDRAEYERLRLLESAFDPHTHQQLDSLGLSEGWQCLEIGAGAGSIMNWLSNKVGADGKVIAVDIDPRFLHPENPHNTRIAVGDLREMDLSELRFDLIHGRYVLLHLKEFGSIIKTLTTLLRPGGWILLEEPDFLAARCLLASKEDCMAFDHVSEAIESMYRSLGNDPSMGLKIPGALSESGLVDLNVVNDAPACRGGSPIARMMGMSAERLREKYIQTKKCSEHDIDVYRSLAENRDTWAIYYSTICVSARMNPDSGQKA